MDFNPFVEQICIDYIERFKKLTTKSKQKLTSPKESWRTETAKNICFKKADTESKRRFIQKWFRIWISKRMLLSWIMNKENV